MQDPPSQPNHEFISSRQIIPAWSFLSVISHIFFVYKCRALMCMELYKEQKAHK